MHNNTEILDAVRKALELYTRLGFEYLPVKGRDISRILTGGPFAAKVRETGDVPVPGKVREAGIDDIDKAEALQAVRNEIGDCVRCKLSRSRKHIVFGEGNPDAEIMFIGEGPGREEDMQARPFVGDAGKLLTRLIVNLGLTREGVYITNVVKCRPPNNRNPEEDEIRTCSPFLEKQIEIIRPKVIVCLGKISSQSLLHSRETISRLRGKFASYRDIPVMPTFHPAYLLRNPKDKWLTWEDMQKVLERVK